MAGYTETGAAALARGEERAGTRDRRQESRAKLYEYIGVPRYSYSRDIVLLGVLN